MSLSPPPPRPSGHPACLTKRHGGSLSLPLPLSARSYLEHVRDTFGENGPPSAFPLPADAAGAAAKAKEKARVAGKQSASLSSRSWGAGGGEGNGGDSSPCLMRVRVGDVSADVTPPSTGEVLCRSLLVRRGEEAGGGLAWEEEAGLDLQNLRSAIFIAMILLFRSSHFLVVKICARRFSYAVAGSFLPFLVVEIDGCDGCISLHP